jgi:acetyltransferase-like isoleucine patch superfamily enzyme
VTVGEIAHIGTGARVIQGIMIGERAMIAAGAVVVRDVLPDVAVAGVPARPMRGDGGC